MKRVKKEILGILRFRSGLAGLGPYIARRIVEAHGGKIWAESEGEGKGSKFFVALEELKENST